MVRITIVGVLLALAGARPAPAGETPEPTVRKLFFVVEPGLAPGRVVAGYLAGTPGADRGFEAACLDLDGDGIPETKQPLGEVARPGAKRPVREYRLRIPAGDETFFLEFEALRSVAATADLGPGPTTVNWSVQGGGLAVRFIGASLALSTTAAEARASKPLRLGPPLAVDLAPGARGSSALVVVTVKDPNGADLGTVLSDGKELRPEVKLLRDGEEKLAATPGYS
jgi:hypothetical protein